MLGMIVLIIFQIIGAGWLSQMIMRAFQNKGWIYGPDIPGTTPGDNYLYLAGIAVFSSIFVWVIGLLCSEIIKDVAKPSNNALLTSLFVAGLVIVFLNVPLFTQYTEVFLLQYRAGFQDFHLVIIGSVVGYHFSK